MAVFKINLTLRWASTTARQLLFLAFLAVYAMPPAKAVATDLHDAIRNNAPTELEALLESGADVDQTDFLLGTPLHLAAYEGRVSLARMLIQAGADVDAVSEQQGAHPTHLAAERGFVEMLRLLLESGANVDALDAYERTPLHRAADGGYLEAVDLLLERGADIEAQEGRYNATALHRAVFRGHIHIVILLVERGAKIDALDRSGWTPLGWAATPASFTAAGGPGLIEYLVEMGADPNHRDGAGLTILMHATNHARNGSPVFPEIITTLRRLGAVE